VKAKSLLLSKALQDHSELVEKYLMKDAVTVDEHRLTALHTLLHF
jgi:Fe-S cluster assembly protein SufD